MFEFGNILAEVIELSKVDIVNSMQANDRVATGDTIKALEITKTDEGAKLMAPDYIDDLEFGSYGAKGNRKPVDPARLARWADARNYFGHQGYLKNRLDAIGYEGRPGVLTQPLSDLNINTHANTKLAKLATIVSNDVAKSISEKLAMINNNKK